MFELRMSESPESKIDNVKLSMGRMAYLKTTFVHCEDRKTSPINER